MEKTVIKSTQLAFTADFPGLKGVNIMASSYPIEPILVFTEYLMDKPVFGPHPHAGISVMTYMLPDSLGSFINRDSNGDFSEIKPGGLHVTQAGRGIHHDEFPKVTGTQCHGFQIWINHSMDKRFLEPKSFHLDPEEIIEKDDLGSKIRVLHGRKDDLISNLHLATDFTLLHIYVSPLKKVPLRAEEMAFVYGLKGSSVINDHACYAQGLVNFSATGEDIVVEAGQSGFEFMFATAKPLNEPIVYGGPFVMTTAEQMAEARKRLGKGLMGRLNPYNG